MRLLIILTIFSLFSFYEHTGKQHKSNAMAGNTDCDKVKKHFNKRLREISWDIDNEQMNEKLITSDFFNKYLKNIEAFKARSEYVDLYYHSIPDIQTDKCLVIIKRVFKYDQYSYSYHLVDLGQNPRVIFELAALENYPDGQQRIKSVFLNDIDLRKIKVTEYLGDYDTKMDKYETIADSLTLTYRLQDNRYVLIKSDSIRTTNK